MANAKHKLAAILSADVVGYWRLMSDDDAATVTTLQEYRAAIGRVVAQHSESSCISEHLLGNQAPFRLRRNPTAATR
mgnify:CR=1 FL=1